MSNFLRNIERRPKRAAHRAARRRLNNRESRMSEQAEQKPVNGNATIINNAIASLFDVGNLLRQFLQVLEINQQLAAENQQLKAVLGAKVEAAAEEAAVQ